MYVGVGEISSPRSASICAKAPAAKAPSTHITRRMFRMINVPSSLLTLVEYPVERCTSAFMGERSINGRLLVRLCDERLKSLALA